MAEPAARYLQKYRSMLSKKVKDEFFVHEKDVILITQFKDKIENVYQIKISFEQKAEDGQWLILDGEPVDRRNAKNYITAMCNPMERKQVQFPSTSCTELTDPATLELIEKRTNAFIRPLEKIAQFEISGTELAITLAFSEIEELAGAALEGDESQFDDEAIVDADGVITISPNTRNGSTRLSSVLERALSANSDGVCSVEDYRHARPAIQRVLANCLQNDDDDIDVDQLFAEGPTTGTSKRSNLMVFYEDSAEERNAVSTVVDADEVTEVQPALTSPPGAFTDKMTGLAISSPPSTALLSKQQDYLRSFGVLVGFQEAEVDKAIKFVDEKTRPSDFLDMLNSLQQQDSDSGDDVVILETETIDLTNDEQASHIPNDSCDTSKSDTQMQGTEENYQSSLPDGYKDMLIRDFFAEGENSSADELKRRNAERQKLLRQNFEKQQSNQHGPQPKGMQPSSVVSKKQNAKGKTKQRKNKQRNAEKQSDRTDMHDKQFRLDSAKNNNETSSHNDEETCVLRVWNNDQDQTGAGTSAQEPVQTTPKRKNSKGRNNQTQLSQPIWVANGGNNQRQNSPNRSSQPGGQWPQSQGQKFNQPVGSPVKGHFRKPTQVVTPVNAANGRFDKMAPQRQCRNDQAELRYVVIDGSNVAMTHGNGKYFSCKGIKLCVDYFRQHGHDKITVFVPQWRQYRPSDDNPIFDQDILRELKEEDILVFTPSRRIGRRLVVAYDDRFVLELAEAEDGVIVSNDQYRDLMTEKAGWRKLIEERLLMYSFAKDLFMPPNDPLGREGPCLADFLRVLKPHQFTPVNPRQWQAYDYHHEQQQHYKSQGQLQQIQGQFQHGQGQQGHNQVQQYQGQFQQGHGQFQHDQGHCKQGHGQYSKSANHGNNSENSQPVQKHGYSVKNKSNQGDETDCGDPYVADHVIGQWKNPQRWDKTDGGEPSVADHVIGQWKGPHQGYPHVKGKVQGHPRTIEETQNLLQELRRIFPESAQEKTVHSILTNHESERDLTKLTNYLMNVLF